MEAALPRKFSAVRERLDTLAKDKHHKVGVDIASAAANFAVGRTSWDQAEVAFNSGQLEEALTLIQQAQSTVDVAAARLQLPDSER